MPKQYIKKSVSQLGGRRKKQIGGFFFWGGGGGGGAIASAAALLIIDIVGKIFGKGPKKEKEEQQENEEKKYEKNPIKNKKLSRTKKLKKKQSCDWLNRYDFTYAGRDTINTGLATFGRMTPALINKALNQIDRIIEQRIQQLVQQDGKEIEQITPKIKKKKNAIEEVYKAPFRLLGKFGRKKYYQIKRKFKSLFRKKDN